MSTSEKAATCVDPSDGELLGAYELGLLTSADQMRFEEHLTRCQACVDALYELAPHSVAMRTHPGEISARLAATKSRPRLLPGRWRVAAPIAAFAAAACVAILLVGGPRDGNFAELAQLDPVAYEPIALRQDGMPESERLRRQGMRAYAEREYEAAAPLLARALVGGQLTTTDRDQAQFFLGLSLMLSDQLDAANVHLEEATRSSVPVIVDRAEWYVAQLHLLQDEPQDALRYLSRLAADSPAYANRAAAQRDAINARVTREQ